MSAAGTSQERAQALFSSAIAQAHDRLDAIRQELVRIESGAKAIPPDWPMAGSAMHLDNQLDEVLSLARLIDKP